MQSCQMAAYGKNKAKYNVNFLVNGYYIVTKEI